MTMTKAGGTKPLAEVPDGTVVVSAQTKTVGGTGWLLVYPDSVLPQNDSRAKASEVDCGGRIKRRQDFDGALGVGGVLGGGFAPRV